MTKEQILKNNGLYIGFKSTYSWDGIIASMQECADQELAKEREENRHLYEQVAMLLSHSGTTNILDAIEKWREERERSEKLVKVLEHISFGIDVAYSENTNYVIESYDKRLIKQALSEYRTQPETTGNQTAC